MPRRAVRGLPAAAEVYYVERARTYAEENAVVWDGVLRFLQANDISVVSADLATGIIHAERTHPV